MQTTFIAQPIYITEGPLQTGFKNMQTNRSDSLTVFDGTADSINRVSFKDEI